MNHQCDNCDASFRLPSELHRHQRTRCPNRPALHICDECGRSFKQKQTLNRHRREQHSEDVYQCDKCDYKADRLSNLRRHQRRHEMDESGPPTKMRRTDDSPDPEVVSLVNDLIGKVMKPYDAIETTALGNRLRVFKVKTTERDPETFLNNIVPQVEEYVTEGLEENTGVKLQIVLYLQFYNENNPRDEIKRHFWSTPVEIYRGTDYDVKAGFPKILKKVEAYQERGSGLVIDRIHHAEIQFIKLQPLRGSTYVPLPAALRSKRAIINIKNKDQKCFMWSIIAAQNPLPPQSHHNRVSNYKDIDHGLNFNDLTFPTPLKDIAKFEENNRISINVYGYDENIYPLRISKALNPETIHLLFYEDHYCLIKDLNMLLHDQRKDKSRKFFCPRCLFPKTTPELLAKHLESCVNVDPTRTEMPDDDILEFQNISRMLRQPLVVYADLECVTEKIDSCTPDPDSSYTQKYQKHTPCGYGLVEAHSCCGASTFKDPVVRRCNNVVEQLLLDLTGIEYEHQDKLNNPIDIDLPDASSIGNSCHICQKEIEDQPVMDHCHMCGRFRGPAHSVCNQQLRLSRDIVVVFHNLRKYDGHLIMQEIGQIAKLQGFEINVIAKAMEDYISFSLKHKKEYDEKGESTDHTFNIKFIDSVQFLNNSLAGLVKNLNDDKLYSLGKIYQGRKFELMKRKGVYPYDYMDSIDRLKERQLPPMEAFYNELNEEGISEADYTHAQEVWNVFQMKTLGDYHDRYLETDVLLLADVFEEFRRFSLATYGLDPAHYYTTPGLAWDACLKFTNAKLELLQDPDMYLFFESGIRGGISQISHRFARANNPRVPGYDPRDPTTWIMYWDANNLYGWAMVQKLAVDGFRWLEREEIDTLDLNDVDGDVGYILEVDLEYPEELHDKHNDYPLAPEPMEINDISPYCRELKEKLGLKIPPQKKLTLNFYKKTKYILHARNLKLYQRLGMKLTHIHRVIAFNQRAWMEPYIMLNTNMRARATNAFDKDLLKLFNNAVFGKTMENVRKYKNIELVTSGPRLEKLVANPRYRNSCRFNDDLVGVASLKPSTKLNKPVYCGLTVLDLSKLLMYEYHYDYVIPNYGERAKLLFTDTDSLCYLIETEDIYKDMSQDSHRFDFSDYPKDHWLHSNANKKVIGKMKDELNGEPGIEFAGLRPKMYSMLPEKKRAKGIKKSVVKKHIKHQDYVNTLMKEETMRHLMKYIKNDLHQMYTVTQQKTSLSPYDDKRFYLDAINSRAHGHKLNKSC